MNQVTLIGRITKDLQMEKAGAHNVLRFSIAVNNGKDKDALFIECEAWNKSAELIEQYFVKGNRIGIIGRININEYENKEGRKVRKFYILVNQVEFIETKKTEQNEEKEEEHYTGPTLDIDVDTLPF